jgi:hypothetical protein
MNNQIKRCQSCGMPLLTPQVYGTQADDSKSNEYCMFCFKGGKFTDPDITMEEMIERTTRILADKSAISREQAKEIMLATIPKLKRWLN